MNELIASKMVQLKENNQINTSNCYRTLLHFIERNFGVVKCCECDAAFVKRMNSAMEGMSQSTKANYFACLKSVWYFAQYKGYTGRMEFPFRRKSWETDKVRIPKMTRRTECWMTRDEMSDLYRIWLSMEDGIRKRYVGLFLCSYLMNGANVADIVRMRYNSDWFASGGKIITFVRRKTAEKSPTTVRVPVTQWLQPILEYLADAPVRGGLVFGSFVAGCTTDDAVNKKVMTLNNCCTKILRKVMKGAGMRDDVSVTYARHSYSTVMNHNGAPFALIEKNLGHSGGGDVAFNYIGAFSDEALFKYNEQLIVCNIA